MELSEEEIIRNVKRIIEYKVISNYINNYDCRVIQGLLDLYYKQQKEIEELKKQNYEIVKELKPRVQIDDTEYIERNFISKDKIREKIEEITSYAYTSVEERECQTYARQVLKDLLEEN